jgi:hypothetical protein
MEGPPEQYRFFSSRRNAITESTVCSGKYEPLGMCDNDQKSFKFRMDHSPPFTSPMITHLSGLYVPFPRADREDGLSRRNRSSRSSGAAPSLGQNTAPATSIAIRARKVGAERRLGRIPGHRRTAVRTRNHLEQLRNAGAATDHTYVSRAEPR